jgi:hypothetical protein
MRRVSSEVARGVVALTVVLVLAGPVIQAAPTREWPGVGREPNPIVKIIKKLIVRVFGDGLVDPRP